MDRKVFAFFFVILEPPELFLVALGSLSWLLKHDHLWIRATGDAVLPTPSRGRGDQGYWLCSGDHVNWNSTWSLCMEDNHSFEPSPMVRIYMSLKSIHFPTISQESKNSYIKHIKTRVSDYHKLFAWATLSFSGTY